MGSLKATFVLIEYFVEKTSFFNVASILKTLNSDFRASYCLLRLSPEF